MTTKDITFSQALVKVTDSNPKAVYRINDAEIATLFRENLTYDEAVQLADSLNNNPDFDGFANITEH